jgi:hypothetical protein
MNAPIIQKNYDFLLYLIPILQKLPRNQKFLLADRIQNLVMDNQEILLTAYYSERETRVGLLQEANLNLEKLRTWFRLCYDLKLINADRYEFISHFVNEIGAMLGGWLKSLK